MNTSQLYYQILVAASILDGVPVQELGARYPEGEFFAIKCHGEAMICAPPQEDIVMTTPVVPMTPVVTVPEEYLGLTRHEVLARRERSTLEAQIDDLRRTLKGKREFHIPLQEATVADRRKKLADSEATLLELQTEAYTAEQELYVLEMKLAELKRAEL